MLCRVVAILCSSFFYLFVTADWGSRSYQPDVALGRQGQCPKDFS